MGRVVLVRLFDATVVLFAVSVLTFLLIRLVPGDAVAVMLGANTEVTPERVAALRASLGLDQPIPLQYFAWIGAALTGDLGTSVWTGRPVAEEILSHIGPTLQLAFMALTFGALLSIPLGVAMANARGSASELGIRLVTILGLTVPSFWLGILFLLALAVLAPSAQLLGHVPFREDPLGSLARMALPALALALPILAQLSRLVRSAMLDALSQDYVRTARAKGATERAVLYRHAARNALIPFVTALGIATGYLLGGAIVVEQVFAIPGLGRLVLGAIAERNYPLLQAAILVATSFVVLVNLAVDLLYAALDPRLRA